MPTGPKTFLFMPESAYGPTNNCVGIGNILRQRGHRVVFAAEASWRGKLEPLGFTEDLVDLAPPPPAPQPGEPEPDAGQFWKDFIRDTAPEFRKNTIDQLEMSRANQVNPPLAAVCTRSASIRPQIG